MAMEQIKRELQALEIPFDISGNQICCFTHIVNLAVKAGLIHLTELCVSDEELDEGTRALVENPMYASLLQGDHVKCGHQLAAFIRDSGLQREDFEAVIQKGNEEGSWGTDQDGNPIQLCVVGLLKDVDTRWSSTFLMIDRVIELRLAIPAFFKLDKYQSYTATHRMSEEQFAILNNIRLFLGLFDVVQELVSAEKTPTLSFVLPMYKKLLTMLEDLKSVLLEIASAISSSQTKLQGYLNNACSSPAYTMAIGMLYGHRVPALCLPGL
ncbi:hypothetical protein FA13DRAFT_1883877 [Coprinellus micaceus]|uniref:Uncharacterized protein n=1 Tax=Coprinellus micaceus TaxID=71717 RepID=A0A4Y7T080_COPMI|nr:hypothetical protein FA13DRAFT_1883877 [Coprinellus micaceus]